MDDLLHEEERHGLKIKIFRDENAEGPDTWGDEGLFLVGYHREFSVDGPKVYYKQPDGGRAKNDVGHLLVEKKDVIRHFTPPADREYDKSDISLAKDYWILPLEAYIHSGVRLALGHEGNFPDRQWDVSQLGAVFVAKKEARTRKRARQLALGLIETWNNYLSGNVYGFIIEDQADDNVESCWGFYGDYDEDGGALLEARSTVDHITEAGRVEKNGQMLFDFAQN